MKISYPTRRATKMTPYVLKAERRGRPTLTTKTRRMSGIRETAVLKKGRIHVLLRAGAGKSPRRFLKQQIIFPIYENAHARKDAGEYGDKRGKVAKEERKAGECAEG